MLEENVLVAAAAFEGMIALTVKLSPIPIVTADLSSLTLDAAGFTVTLQVADLLFAVFTVIVAVPAFLAVSLPFDTVTIEALLLVHVTVLNALDGVIVVVRL